MIHHLDENGIMATVLPHGVLFRGGSEAHIRRYLIEDRNYIDAVIGLPANIFFGTGIPTCILVIKKCREVNEDILFIDASNHFEKKGKDNKLLPNHIDDIVDTYTNREIIDKYSCRATLKEIENNDFNLNISRYVDTFEKEALINITAVAEKIKSLDIEIEETNNRIASYCKELNIETPF